MKLLIADVIAPVFLAPYVGMGTSWLVLPFALLLELVIFAVMNREAKLFRLVPAVLFANAVSTLVGTVILLLLSAALQDVEQFRWVNMLAVILSFPIAFGLSVVIEYKILKFTARWISFTNLLRSTFISNVGSYLLLAASLAWVIFAAY